MTKINDSNLYILKKIYLTTIKIESKQQTNAYLKHEVNSCQNVKSGVDRNKIIEKPRE